MHTGALKFYVHVQNADRLTYQHIDTLMSSTHSSLLHENVCTQTYIGMFSSTRIYCDVQIPTPRHVPPPWSFAPAPRAHLSRGHQKHTPVCTQ